MYLSFLSMPHSIIISQILPTSIWNKIMSLQNAFINTTKQNMHTQIRTFSSTYSKKLCLHIDWWHPGSVGTKGFNSYICVCTSFSLIDNLVHRLGSSSDGSGPKPGPGPARSPGFLESPRPDIGRRAQARARPEPVVKSPGAQRALGIWLSFKKLALLWKILSKNIKSQMQIIFFSTFSLSLVPLFIFQVFLPNA